MSDNNIHFLLHEDNESKINDNNDSIFDIHSFLNEIENDESQQDLMISNIIHYHENFTIKELLVICDYYGIAKELKSNKCKKETIIQVLTNFEYNSQNYDIVSKRKNLWFYINELKSDKFMKKYILF